MSRCFSCLFCLVVLQSASGEELDSSTACHRVSLGIGFNSMGLPYGTWGFGGMISYAYQPGKYVYTVRFGGGQSEFTLLGPIAPLSIEELSVMIGGAQFQTLSFFTYSAGVSFSDVGTRGKPIHDGNWFGPGYEIVNTYGLGLLGELQGMFAPEPYVGLGITITASINSYRPFLAAALTLQFGQLRF